MNNIIPENIPQGQCPQCAMPDISMKFCRGCNRSLPATLEFFGSDRSKRDHLYTLCRYCTSPEGKEKRVQAKIANALPDGFRKCTKCQQIKPATSEYFDYRDAKCGTLHAECKPCKAERWQKHLQENPQYWHNWYQERAEHVKASVREYYQEHTGERIAYRKKYYLEHREECLAKVSIYKRTHRGAYTALQHKRNAMKNGVPGTHTDKDIQDQYKRQKGKCYYCSCKLGKQRGDYTVDHVIPISRGGSNAPSNLVITCPSCNFSKHNKLPHEWPQGGRLM